MKKIARLLFVPVLLMVVFSLMPTGSSTDEVLAGYQSTTSFSASGSSYLLYMMQFRLAKDSDYDAKFASSIGQSISALAVDLCEQLGNGGNTSYSDAGGRKIGQFRYSTSSTGDYATSNALRSSVVEMLRNPSKTSNISCCAFATFCWEVLLTGNSPYGTGCTTTVAGNFQNIIEGDGTMQYVIDHAKPGDILFYTKIAGSSPPTAVNGAYSHAELYIGSYSGVDASGNPYEIEHACAGSNEPTNRRDACIKPLATTVPRGRYVYLVSLEKWVASGNTPVNNADQVESIEDIVVSGR